MAAGTTPASVRTRDATFDIVKGMLVLLMVVYHVLSIASTAGPEAYRYIRFISGSFVFITGFIVTRFIGEAFAQAPATVSLRLLVRGAKVLAIFTVLNLAIQASGFGNPAKPRLGVTGFFDEAARLYLAGDGRSTSFLILLPIAYLLMLAPAVLRITRTGGPGRPLALMVSVAALSAWPDVEGRWPVVDFLLVGMAGMAAGLQSLSRHLLPAGRAMPWPLIAAGLPVAVLVSGWLAEPLLAYSASVAIVLRFLHDLAARHKPGRRWTRTLVLLGQYSLPAYIGQIVLIQLLFRAAGAERTAPGLHVLLHGLAAAVLTITLCVGLDLARRRAAWCDRAYRFVFG